MLDGSAVADFGLERLPAARPAARARRRSVSQPIDVPGQLRRLVLARQVLGKQHVARLRARRDRRAWCPSGNSSSAASRLTSVMYFTRRNRFCTAIGQRLNPIQDHRRLGLVEQLQRHRARHGQAALGQVDQLRRAADEDLDRQAAVGHGLAGQLGLVRLEAGHGEADVGHLRANQSRPPAESACRLCSTSCVREPGRIATSGRSGRGAFATKCWSSCCRRTSSK